jgi:DNA-binding CsgD family transcriptional regulator
VIDEMVLTRGFNDPWESAEGVGLISFCRAALLNNGLGRYARALVAAERACDYPQELGFRIVVLPELVEAASRTARIERAIQALERLAEATSVSGSDWALGVEKRSKALVSDGENAECLYWEAIDRLGRTNAVMELARAHLLYGEWLRREGRRIEARGELRTAHEMFVDMGAGVFVKRASRELLATGETARKRSVETRFDLTAQEEEIALLAGDGRTNTEIATELFLSPRTVEWHLRKVFPKLGVSSRRDLRVVLPSRHRLPLSAQLA